VWPPGPKSRQVAQRDQPVPLFPGEPRTAASPVEDEPITLDDGVHEALHRCILLLDGRCDLAWLEAGCTDEFGTILYST
jgi:hypothetical protein